MSTINDDETILPIYHNFNFKRFAIATIITTIVGGVVVSFNRSSINNDHQLRNNRALVVGAGVGHPITECIINAVDLLQIPEEAPIVGGDVQYECDNGSNFIPIKFDAAQITALKDKVATGEAIFAKSKLDVEGEIIDDEDGIIKFTPGRLISILAHEKKEVPWDRGRRNLQKGTGNKYFILFRVTDSNGLVYSHSASVMSDNMFGTGTDSVNLKTQLDACSVGKYIVIPGGKNGYDFSGLESAPGVVDITIPISLDNSMYSVRNAVIASAKEKLGNYFGLSTTTHLMTYMDHALYSLEGCYQGKQK